MPKLFNYGGLVEIPDYVRSPFPRLALTNIIGRGEASLILSFPHGIALKSPYRYKPSSEWSEKTTWKANEHQAQAQWSMQMEATVYAQLLTKPNRNVLRPLLIVDEGIFMPRMESTLEAHILSWSLGFPEVVEEMKNRWIIQFTAGAAWLEDLGFVHGDLRSGNILIDHRGNAKLSDFGSTDVPGETHQPWIDQYGIGQIVWSLFNQNTSGNFVNLPCDWEDPQTLPLPPLQAGPTLLIERCLRINYISLRAVHKDVVKEFSPRTPKYSAQAISNYVSARLGDLMDSLYHWILVQRCRQLCAHLRDDRILHMKIGALSTAEMLFKQALEEREKAMGPNASFTAEIVSHLGALYTWSGDYDKAELFWNRAITCLEKVAGPDYMTIILASHNLGRDSEARELLEKTIQGWKESGQNIAKPEADSRYCLAKLYEMLEDRKAEAGGLFRTAAERYERALGKEHPQTKEAWERVEGMRDGDMVGRLSIS
ncbi:MAG: hypothetical protein Q9170_002481 [Blastenia crenularia]